MTRSGLPSFDRADFECSVPCFGGVCGLLVSPKVVHDSLARKIMRIDGFQVLEQCRVNYPRFYIYSIAGDASGRRVLAGTQIIDCQD